MSEDAPKKPHAVGYLYDLFVSRFIDSIVTKRLGYTILAKTKAEEAILHIPEADLVISDVTDGGYDVYNAARAYGKPIIMINGGFLDFERTPEAVVILKPFKISELEAAVRKCAEGLKPNREQ